jgi:hypothetical protein
MSNLTAEQLLAAVGITRDSEPGWWPAMLWENYCDPEYIGPALDTPELEAILLVAGQKVCSAAVEEIKDLIHDKLELTDEALECEYIPSAWLLFVCTNPGHALARAIAEVRG